MAIDPLAQVYTGDGGQQIGDGTGGAIKFGRSPEIDYSQLIRRKQEQATMAPKFNDDLSAAQLGKAWAVDQPALKEKYNQYLEEIKSWESTPEKQRTTDQWKTLMNKKAELVFDVNKSADDQAHFMQVYNKVYGDDKMRYAEEDFKALDDFAAQPLDKRGRLNINPASTISAGKTIYDMVKGIGLDDDEVYTKNADGSYSMERVKAVDPDKLRERIRAAINDLPQNQAYALRKEAIETNPLIIQEERKNPGAFMDMLVDGQMIKILPNFGHIKKDKSAAAPDKSGVGKREDTATGIKNSKYSVDLIMRDGSPVIVANPMPGTKEELKEVDWIGWNSENIKGEFKEIIPPEKSKSGQREMVISQTYIDPLSIDKNPKQRLINIPATDNNLTKFGTIYTGGAFDVDKFIKTKSPAMKSKTVVTDRNKGGQVPKGKASSNTLNFFKKK